MSTLGTILKDNWAWRKQIGRLALFELVKKSRGAVLSWSWFFIKPAMYIFCFWFALDIGLRVGSGAGKPVPRRISWWLCAGLIPWFFMQDMLGAGIDVMHRYPYLGEQDQVPAERYLDHFHGRYHACAVDAYGGAFRHLFHLRHVV